MAIRQGDYKLIESAEDGHVELYNLAEDREEQFDLSFSMRQNVVELRNTLRNWRDALGAHRAKLNPPYDPLAAASARSRSRGDSPALLADRLAACRHGFSEALSAQLRYRLPVEP